MGSQDILILNPDQKVSCLHAIKDLYFAAKQLHEWIKDDQLTKEMSETLPSLIESHFCAAAKVLNYESVLTKEKEKRHEAIRKANGRIRELEEQLASQRSTDGLKEQLQKLYRNAYGWWEEQGFSHLSEFQYSGYGVVSFELYFRLDAHRRARFSDTPVTDQEKKVDKILRLVEKGFELTQESESSRSWEVLDTPNNRKLIKEMLEERFPSINIHAYRSWSKNNDQNDVYIIRNLEACIYNLNELEA